MSVCEWVCMSECVWVYVRICAYLFCICAFLTCMHCLCVSLSCVYISLCLCANAKKGPSWNINITIRISASLKHSNACQTKVMTHARRKKGALAKGQTSHCHNAWSHELSTTESIYLKLWWSFRSKRPIWNYECTAYCSLGGIIIPMTSRPREL